MLPKHKLNKAQVYQWFFLCLNIVHIIQLLPITLKLFITLFILTWFYIQQSLKMDQKQPKRQIDYIEK